MFGIGIPELILVALVALVVVGPKNLPTTLRALGRAIREFQRASRELRRDAGFDEVVEEVTRPLREGLSGIEEDVKRQGKGIEDAVKHEDRDDPGFDLSMEYPESGPDDYGALPEGAGVYPEEDAEGGVPEASLEASPEAAPAVAPEAAPVVAEAPAAAGQEERS